ncbi:hypothetical protein [Micromonospora arida]|uniref:hypothetical protein n=1 Tax=Micromonospora arida TaxID=2203715 RepID=UPI000F5EA564|nr:hypothetical protein [Micromonospora arida]
MIDAYSGPVTESERASWWNSIGGLLTGFAAVITAIGALIGALHVVGVIGGTGAAAPSQDATGPGAGADSPPAGSPSRTSTGKVPVAPSVDGASGQGLLTISSITSADLESGIVGFGVPGQDFMVMPGGRTFGLNGTPMGTYFSTIGSDPRKEACVEALTTNRLGDLDIDADSLGRWWCVRTNEGHTGAITVKTVSVEAPRELVLGYVLWR